MIDWLKKILGKTTFDASILREGDLVEVNWDAQGYVGHEKQYYGYINAIYASKSTSRIAFYEIRFPEIGLTLPFEPDFVKKVVQ